MTPREKEEEEEVCCSIAQLVAKHTPINALLSRPIIGL